jgi:uncharacterized protein (TIRG00374 family)
MPPAGGESSSVRPTVERRCGSIGAMEKRAGLGSKTPLRSGIFVGVLVIVIYGALLFLAEADELAGSLAGFGILFTLFLVLVSTLNFAFRFVRWHLYLRKLNIDIPLRESLAVFLSGFAMSITPGKAGEVIKSIMLKRSRGIPVSHSISIIATERVSDISGLLFLIAIGVMFLPGGAVYAAVLGAAILALQWACASERVGRFIILIASKVPFLKRTTPMIETMYSRFRALAGAGTYLSSFFLSVMAWGAQCVVLYLAANSMPNAQLSLPESLFIYSGPLIAGNLATLPGGLGLTEGSMAGLLVQLGGEGMTLSAAAAVTLVVRAVTLWWGLLVGNLALLYWRVRFDKDTAPEPAD